ncbi:hypothetical protein D8I35_16635 [Corticibacter populi]|uniref:Lipoprotein n=1 Tax=Corticibacter populi TaxID=1550736 RepID=A0A3M6QM69_9BURK|nr:hypothetical protein [Corticibacter populi]RMX03502.1 hypothetical protein D8I35_16635 [Corticibacter populi]RZS29947.1 hypothetical protein EV687_3432 [Corticibacter populi]
MSIQLIKNRVYRLTGTGVVAAAVGLALGACTQEPEPPADLGLDAGEIARQAAAEMQSDQRLASELLTQLQKTDPRIFDAYIELDAQGRKVAVISRRNDDDSIESWTTPPIEQILQNSQSGQGQQEAQAGGPSMGQMLAGAAMGALAGYALANMFSSGAQRFGNAGQYQQAKTASQSSYQRSVAQNHQQRAATRASALRQQGAFSGNNAAPRRSTMGSGS